MKYKMAIVALGVCLMLGAGVTVAADKNSKKDKDATVAAPVLVNVTNVTTEVVPNQVSALGTLVALKSVTISSEVDGRISKIFFKDGQQVAEGMPIIQLDNEQAKANYESAVTALNLSRKKYQRALAVSKLGAISQEDVDTLQAAVESNKAKVKSSLASLNEKEIMAPFNGVLGAFKVQAGDYVSSGDPLVDLVNSDQLKAEFSVPQNFKPELKLNQSVKITTSAYPNKSFNGTVTYISPSVDPATRSIAIQAVINNKQQELSPGMFVNVTQILSMKQNALVIPEQAVTASVQGYQVYKVVQDKAQLTDIEIGVRKDGMVEVLKGLAKGDTVVTAGQQKLQDGSSVTILSNGNNQNQQ